MTITETNKLEQLFNAMNLIEEAFDNTEETNIPEIEQSMDIIYRETLKIRSIIKIKQNENRS